MSRAGWFFAGVLVGAPVLVAGIVAALVSLARLMDRIEEERGG